METKYKDDARHENRDARIEMREQRQEQEFLSQECTLSLRTSPAAAGWFASASHVALSQQADELLAGDDPDAVVGLTIR
jgi:predicted lysophospholipase L1 biosynthesis ABC-type transport system permease subunit